MRGMKKATAVLSSALSAVLSLPLAAQAPVLLGDLQPGPAGSRPSSYVLFGQLGQRTLFNADDGSGVEPWITDGTPAGTFRLGDLYPGATGSTPREYTAVGNRAVFAAFLPGVGEELAVTDGTVAGTGLLADLRPGLANGNPIGLVRFRDEVIFSAFTGTGLSIWRTDGTPAGTYMHPVLPTHCFAGIVAGNRLFWFRPNQMYELWCWDGTAAPAIVTTFPQVGATAPPGLAGALRDRALIAGALWNNVQTWWTSNGTAVGTQPFAANVVSPGLRAIANDRMFFSSGGGPTQPLRLWVTDGTPLGTSLVVQTSGTTQALWAVGDRAFLAFLGAGPLALPTLCVSDGTPTGTQFVLREVSGLVAVGQRRAAFVASDPAHGTELWLSDGTTNGTALFADVRPGTGSSFDSMHLLHHQGGRLLFWADDGVHGQELFALHTGAGAKALAGGCHAGPIPELFADDPVLGGQVTVRGRSQLVTAPGFVVLGPVAVAPLSLGACQLHVDLGIAPIVVPCTTDAAGAFTLPPLPVPALPALDGMSFAAQAALVAPSAPLLGLAISNAVLLTIGM